MLEDDESTQTLQPNILQLDELLTTDADDELFGASDYLPAVLVVQVQKGFHFVGLPTPWTVEMVFWSHLLLERLIPC
ncbi:hypothetical protein MtrunA17_Chr1g0174711 [Medicago truncatula]|uniref:Uncharacterized protein n=1 Tax=Medicago truncatula TaxID=3880 RepID=A0A396JSB5_MEDTR|nr:hypothetical protein MtrunA17_Chr1g0174711 [Medicago truncatula]